MLPCKTHFDIGAHKPYYLQRSRTQTKANDWGRAFQSLKGKIPTNLPPKFYQKLNHAYIIPHEIEAAYATMMET